MLLFYPTHTHTIQTSYLAAEMVAGDALEAEVGGIDAMGKKAEKDAAQRALDQGVRAETGYGEGQGQGQKRKFVAATVN